MKKLTIAEAKKAYAIEAEKRSRAVMAQVGRMWVEKTMTPSPSQTQQQKAVQAT